MKALTNFLPLALAALPWLANPAAGRLIHANQEAGHMYNKPKSPSVVNSNLQKTLDKQQVRSYVTDDSIHHLSHANPETPLGLQKRRVEHLVQRVDSWPVNLHKGRPEKSKSLDNILEDQVDKIEDAVKDVVEDAVEKVVEKKINQPLQDAFPQMREKMHGKCFEPNDHHVYFYVQDPRGNDFGRAVLAAIHPAWKKKYPRRLRKAVEQAGYHVINATVVDAWTSSPHDGKWTSKMIANGEIGTIQEPCSWHEVDSISAAGVPRGSIWYWTEAVFVNRTLGMGLLELDPSEFVGAKRLRLNTTFIDFRRIPGEDIFEIRKILLRTFPKDEITDIAAGAIIGGLAGFVLFIVGWFALKRMGVQCCLRRKNKKVVNTNKREKAIDSIELRDRVAAPEYSASGLESARAPEPWRVV